MTTPTVRADVVERLADAYRKAPTDVPVAVQLVIWDVTPRPTVVEHQAAKQLVDDERERQAMDRLRSSADEEPIDDL
jgi:hypothetical protein